MPEHSTLARFVERVAAGDDGEAEGLSQQLQSTDEAALLEMAQSDDVDQRWWAIRALAHCGTPAALSTLVAAFTDADAGVRAAAALAYAPVYQRTGVAVESHLTALAALLTDGDGLVRQTAADALSMCGDAAVPALQTVLAGAHEGARARAAYALRKIATLRAAPILYRHLEDPNHLVRMHAHEALDEMGLLENVLVTL